MSQTRSELPYLDACRTAVHQALVFEAKPEELAELHFSLQNLNKAILQQFGEEKDIVGAEDIADRLMELLDAYSIPELQKFYAETDKVLKMEIDNDEVIYRLLTLNMTSLVALAQKLQPQLIADLSALQNYKSFFGSTISPSEKSLIDHLNQHYQKNELTLTHLASTYLESYLQTRSLYLGHTATGLLSHQLKQYFMQIYPDLQPKGQVELSQGIKNTEENRLLCLIGKNDFRATEPFRKEALKLLKETRSLIPGEPHKERLTRLLKLLERLGPHNYTFVSKLFHGADNPNQKVSEAMINEHLSSPEKFQTLKNNLLPPSSSLSPKL